MHGKAAVAILFMLVHLKGSIVGTTSTVVDLTKEAETHIESLKEPSGTIDSWGLTANYSYWTGKRFSKGECPIEATVGKLECVTFLISKDDESDSQNECEEVFTWNITRGIQSPFPLLVNVTVPMISVPDAKPEVVTLDLNNATLIIKQLKDNGSRAASSASSKTQQLKTSCIFEVEVSFTGLFAYHFKYPRGDKPLYQSVDVKQLKNSTKGLLTHEKSLVYKVEGEYTQILCSDKV